MEYFMRYVFCFKDHLQRRPSCRSGSWITFARSSWFVRLVRTLSHADVELVGPDGLGGRDKHRGRRKVEGVLGHSEGGGVESGRNEAQRKLAKRGKDRVQGILFKIQVRFYYIAEAKFMCCSLNFLSLRLHQPKLNLSLSEKKLGAMQIGRMKIPRIEYSQNVT